MKKIIKYSGVALLTSGFLYSMDGAVSTMQKSLASSTNQVRPHFTNMPVTMVGSQHDRHLRKKHPSARIDAGKMMFERAQKLTCCDLDRHMPAIQSAIDTKLAIGKDDWFPDTKRNIRSHYLSVGLSYEERIRELEDIDSLVKEICYPGLFFEQLSKNNKYFQLLLDEVITHQANQYYYVKGSTIDSLQDEKSIISNLSLALSRFINLKARSLYEQWRRSLWLGCWNADSCPQKMSRELYTHALRNSKDSWQELVSLRDSKTMEKLRLIDGVSELNWQLKYLIESLSEQNK
jgi:hypothetical protein